MAIDLDALEAVTKAVGPPPLDRQWTQREVIRAHQICLHAPTLVAEHRALLARVGVLEAEVAQIRGPVTEFARGYGPGDGDSKALEPKP